MAEVTKPVRKKLIEVSIPPKLEERRNLRTDRRRFSEISNEQIAQRLPWLQAPF